MECLKCFYCRMDFEYDKQHQNINPVKINWLNQPYFFFCACPPSFRVAYTDLMVMLVSFSHTMPHIGSSCKTPRCNLKLPFMISLINWTRRAELLGTHWLCSGTTLQVPFKLFCDIHWHFNNSNPCPKDLKTFQNRSCLKVNSLKYFYIFITWPLKWSLWSTVARYFTCVCVCVCVRERERECVWERERDFVLPLSVDHNYFTIHWF